MSVSAAWYDEAQTMIRYVFEGAWTWDEFDVTFKQVLAMLDTVDHKVDLIVDMLNGRKIPSNALQRAKYVADVQHPNGGITIYVGTNPLLQALGQIFLKVYPRSAQVYPFDFASTIDEAVAKIKSRRDRTK